MQQIQIHAEKERVWHLLSDPEEWHRWAPWVRFQVKEPKAGSRVYLGAIPTPGRITRWQEGEGWDWKWISLSVSHDLKEIKPGLCLVRIGIQGPGHVPAEILYGPMISYSLKQLAKIAEQSAE